MERFILSGLTSLDPCLRRDDSKETVAIDKISIICYYYIPINVHHNLVQREERKCHIRYF